MKIAYFSKTDIPSFSANSNQSMQVCAAMTRLGHSVTFFVIAEENSDEQVEPQEIFDFYDIEDRFLIKKLSVPDTRGSRLRYLWSVLITIPRVIKELFQGNFDLVFGRDLISCCVAIVFRLRTIYESHAPVWLGLVEGSIFKIIVHSRYFWKLVVISHSLREEYLSHYGSFESKIHVAPDGSEVKPKGMGYDVNLKGKSSKLRVGYVGQLYEGKGVEVIEAIAKDMPDIDFHVIGGSPEDVIFWQKRMISDNVFFYGSIKRKHLACYYRSLDVCLLPNQEEVFGAGDRKLTKRVNIGSYTSPLKLFEYMAHGKAIVASDLPVLREVLHEGIAVFVSPKDFAGWKEAIRILLSPEKRAKLGLAAKEELALKYSWTGRMEKILVRN